MTTVHNLNRQVYTPLGNVNTPANPIVPAVPQQSEEELLAVVAPALYSYHVKYDEAVEQSEKSQQLFMGFDGLYLRRTEVFNGNKVSIITKTQNAPGLRTPLVGLSGVEITNKVPFHILKDLIANFKAIYDRDKTESSAQVYRLKGIDPMFPGKQAGDYVCYFPKQKNSSAHTNYSEDQDAVINIRQKHTLVMESHSHAAFGAFFSGGDDRNEKAPLMYCVIGNFTTPASLTFAGRVKLMEYEKRFEVTELFDIPADVVNALSTESLPEPSAQMLANANTGTAVNTAAELAEEREKLGITTPYASSSYKGSTYGRNYYGGRTNYGSHYSRGGHSSLFDTDDDIKYSSKHKSKRDKRKNSLKLDVEWLADNLSRTDSITLLNLLADKLEANTNKGGQE